MKAGLDKRSRAYRIRKEAVTKASDVMLMHLKAAINAGINASYVLFDSWFAYPATIIKVRAQKLHVVSRVKDTTKIKYLINDEKKTAKEIFRGNKKRRGKSRYLLSVPVTLYAMDGKIEVTIPARLVYVRNRNKRNEWIALISTDMELSEEDVISTYGKRWDIEVFFKICKSYLRLTNEFQQLSYDALTARTAIVMIRYMILSVERRTMEDPRTLGELFFLGFDEAADVKFDQALMLIIALLSDTLREEHLGLSEEQMDRIMDSFVEKLPTHIRNCLSQGNAA
jgi:transposase